MDGGRTDAFPSDPFGGIVIAGAAVDGVGLQYGGFRNEREAEIQMIQHHQWRMHETAIFDLVVDADGVFAEFGRDGTGQY